MEKLKIALFICIICVLYLIFYQLNLLTEENQAEFTYKDGEVLYNLCNKKRGPQHNFILKSYGDEETKFKKYILNQP